MFCTAALFYRYYNFGWLALSVKSFGFASSPKVGALGSPRKVHLYGLVERRQAFHQTEIINNVSTAYAQSKAEGI